MVRWVPLVLAWLAVGLMAGDAGPAAAAEGRRPLVAVALSFDQQERWARDLGAMRDYAASLDVDLLVEVAKNNQMQQNFQVGKLLAQKPDVLILTAHDAAGAAFLVKKARDQGVKVICYDRLVLNVDVDLYLSYDDETIGEMQARYLTERAPAGGYVLISGSPGDYNSFLLKAGAMKVLRPLIDSGKITVLAEGPVIDWDPAEAGTMVRQVLDRGETPVAVLAPNDLTAEGIVQVLTARRLAGQVLVTGQDAELAAARRIVAGVQSMTVFKDTRLLGAKAVELAVKMAVGQSLDDEVNTQFPSGHRLIPTVLLTPVLVDRDNLERVLVDSGYLAPGEVYGRMWSGQLLGWKRH